MKTDISSLEIHYLLKELQFLVDQKIDKIYHPSKEELIINFHVTGKGKHILKILAGKYMFLTETKEAAEEPSGFCMFLRKHLNNARLRSIKQLGSERIVEFVFEKKEGKEKLVVELFGSGNILLIDDENLILSAIYYHIWKDRTIRPKVEYTYPKRPVNFLSMTSAEFKKTIQNSTKDSIVKSLAIDFGFGGSFSEELCLLSDLDKSIEPTKLSPDQIKALFDSISELLKKPLEPFVVYKDDSSVAAIPFNLNVFVGFNKKSFESFSKALDFFINANKVVKKSPKEKLVEKLQRVQKKQEEKIKELQKKEEIEKEKAESIYQNYQLIDEILKEIKKASEKYSWKEIKDKLKDHKIIKAINIKDKKITIKLP